MNSIAAYVIAHIWQRFIIESLRIHLGPGFFQVLGGTRAAPARDSRAGHLLAGSILDVSEEALLKV